MTGWRFGGAGLPFLIAGPCVVEPNEVLFRIGDHLAELGRRLGIRICFKASFDKANRSGIDAARGPGLEEGLAALDGVRRRTGLPLLTDVHEPGQVARVAEVVDVLQVPAFLSRQTDLLVACGAAGKPVNVKKGQWMDAEAMRGAVEKVRRGGSTEVAVTERGTFFGYGDLVVDYRNVSRLRAATGAPVIFDATHSVQQPGRGQEGTSGGAREHVPALLLAAAAAGVDGFFLETHPEPASALSDRAIQWPLDRLDGLVERALGVWRAATAGA